MKISLNTATVQDLQRFGEAAGNKKLYVKKQGGDTFLYTTDRNSGKGLKHSLLSAPRQYSARVSLGKLLGKHAKDGVLKSAVSKSWTGNALRGTQLSGLARFSSNPLGTTGEKAAIADLAELPKLRDDRRGKEAQRKEKEQIQNDITTLEKNNVELPKLESEMQSIDAQIDVITKYDGDKIEEIGLAKLEAQLKKDAEAAAKKENEELGSPDRPVTPENIAERGGAELAKLRQKLGADGFKAHCTELGYQGVAELCGGLEEKRAGLERKRDQLQGVNEQLAGKNIPQLRQQKAEIKGEENVLTTERDAIDGQMQDRVHVLAAKVRDGLLSKAANMSPQDAKAFRMGLLSGGDVLLQEKSAYLRGAAKTLGGEKNGFAVDYQNASREIRDFVDQIFDEALPGVDPECKFTDATGENLRHNGTNWKREKIFGASQGVVYLYKEVGGNRELIVKGPPDKAKPKKKEEYKKELAAHLQVTGDPRIIKLEGAVMNAKGSLFLLMEIAEHGDVSSVQEKLSTAKLSDAQKQTVLLTMLYDMATALEACHQLGVVHADIKPHQFFVGKDGVAKLGDFGTSGGKSAVGPRGLAGAQVTHQGESPVQCYIWKSPEHIYGSNESKTTAEANVTKVNKRIEEAGREMDALGLTGRDKEVAVNKVVNAYKRELNAQTPGEFTIDDRADVWSFGVAAFQMLFNAPESLPPELGINPNDFGYENEQKLVDFMNRGELLFQGKHLTPEQNFINWVLHPDPTKRPTMTEVAHHPIFTGTGELGEARKLVMSLFAQET